MGLPSDPRSAARKLIAEHGDRAVGVAGDAAVAALRNGDLEAVGYWKKVVWHAERMWLGVEAAGKPKN